MNREKTQDSGHKTVSKYQITSLFPYNISVETFCFYGRNKQFLREKQTVSAVETETEVCDCYYKAWLLLLLSSVMQVDKVRQLLMYSGIKKCRVYTQANVLYVCWLHEKCRNVQRNQKKSVGKIAIREISLNPLFFYIAMNIVGKKYNLQLFATISATVLQLFATFSDTVLQLFATFSGAKLQLFAR